MIETNRFDNWWHFSFTFLFIFRFANFRYIWICLVILFFFLWNLLKFNFFFGQGKRRQIQKIKIGTVVGRTWFYLYMNIHLCYIFITIFYNFFILKSELFHIIPFICLSVICAHILINLKSSPKYGVGDCRWLIKF